MGCIPLLLPLVAYLVLRGWLTIGSSTPARKQGHRSTFVTAYNSSWPIPGSQGDRPVRVVAVDSLRRIPAAQGDRVLSVLT